MIGATRFERTCLAVSSAFCLTYGPLSTHGGIVHALLSTTLPAAAVATVATVFGAALTAHIGARANAAAVREEMLQTLDRQRREAQEMMAQRDRRIFAQPPSPDQRPPRPWSLDT